MRQYLRPSLSVFSLLLALLVPSLVIIEAAHSESDSKSAPASRNVADASRVRQNYGRLPLSFEANRGQADARVRFLARNGAYSVYLTADEVALALRNAGKQADAQSRAAVVRIKLLGASRTARSYGLDELEGKSNYLIGSDPSRWRTNVPNYGKVRYEGVYPGVDVVYYGTQRQLEYDFVLAPGADAGRIMLRVDGAQRISLDANGDLVLATAAGEVRQRAPHAYQEIEGVRQTIACRYVLGDAGRVGFELGTYDRSKPLVIDPVIGYSTYLGGSGYEEGAAIAVDAVGNAYVTGTATSLDFPVTPGAFRTRRGGGTNPFLYDAFVTKLNSDGSALVYSTYLGSTSDDGGTSIAVDGAGRAHVAGVTSSTSFPTTSGAYRTSRAGGQDAFVAQLNETGSSLLYSTYLGGVSDETGARIALGSGGEIYVAGRTQSGDFPTTPGALRTQPETIAPFSAEGFVTKLMPTPGAGLSFSTFLGGMGDDYVEGLAVANALDGSVYVTGRTNSPNFPTTPNGFFQTLAGDGSTYDAFVTRLNSNGTALIYSTYHGGDGNDYGSAIAVDASGAAYVAGATSSEYFPVTWNAFQMTFGGGDPGAGTYFDAFVTKLSTEASADIQYSTLFGGNGADRANAVAVDAQGNAYVAGETNSTNLPVSPEAGNPFGIGAYDGFVVKFNQQATARDYASYLGGIDTDQVRGVALDAYGGVYMTGTTYSTDFPVTPNILQPQHAGGSDSFVTKIVLGITSQTYSMSGRVTNQYGNGLRDADVILYSPFYRIERTDADGNFTINDLPHGSEVRLYATRYGFTFIPVDAVFPNISRNETVNFSGHAPLAISGRVLDEQGSPVQVPVTLSGSASGGPVVTTPDGSFFFIVPAGGSYTVTPSPHPDYTFTPASQSVSAITADQTLNFVARPRSRIFGRVLTGSGAVVPNMQVTLTSPSLAQPLVRTTDSYGSFTFDNLTNGANYTVTPSDPATNRSFSPAQQVINNIQGAHNITFTSLPPLRILGRVTDELGNGIPDASLTLAGAASATVTSDTYGNFEFTNLPRGGNYDVTINHGLYYFTPPSVQFASLSADQFISFNGARRLFTLTGRATDAEGAALSNVKVTLGGSANSVTQTDASGNYSFADLIVAHPYTVTASRPGFTFAPATVNIEDPQYTQWVNFTGTRLTYTIGGRFTDKANGAGVAGATITLSGGRSATTETDAEGNYSFTGLPSEGDYTVHISHPHFSIGYPTFTYFNLLYDINNLSWSAHRLPYNLSGRVADSSGVALGGVTITLGGAHSGTTQTDFQGRYFFNGLAAGLDYTVTATRTHYTFNPPTRQLDDISAETTVDFTATLLTHNIGGRVVDVNGNGFAGATVSLTGTRNASVTTGADGSYSFNALPAGGSYTVEAARAFYDFNPVRSIFNDLGADQSANFAATLRTFSIGGRVAEGASGVAGVTVSLSGSRTATTQTDAAGNYLFTQLPADGAYNVAPAHPFFNFTPTGKTFNTLPANQTADFSAARKLYQVGGATVDACGRAIPGVNFALTRDGVTTNTQANSSGLYNFNNVQAGYNYTLTPSGAFYTYSPVSVVLNALGANQTINFTGTPPTTTVEVTTPADLYVRGGTSAGTNFGAATQLITRLASQAKDTYETYLKFDVGQRCTVSSVKIRLYGQLNSNSTMNVGVYAVPTTTWTETGTNWNNKPAAGTLLRTVALSGATARWYEWDVTNYVRTELNAGRTVVSFVLKSTSTTNYHATFNSRQATGSNAPRLAITTP